MRRFVEGVDRSQTTLFPESLDDWVDENNLVRVIDAFVDALDLRALGFDGVVPAAIGRPSYHPAILLKLYIYGYLNRVQSSRRLEREASRNVELMWLTGRLMPDHKTIANFRKDSGRAIRQVCAQFVVLCRKLGLLSTASVAIDGSKFKSINNRDKNFTRAKVERRRAQIEESVARYLRQLDTADRHDPTEALAARTTRLKEKIARLEQEMQRLAELEAVQRRLDLNPGATRRRREVVEHPFGTIKLRMGAIHFLLKQLPKVRGEMALHVLAYNLTRVLNILGIQPLMAALRA